jgi:hypothetical protein
VFSNPDGTLISNTTTDVNGEATETVPGDAMVTVLQTLAANDLSAFTIVRVQPGDSIVIDIASTMDPAPTTDTVDIEWPGTFTGATDYTVTDGCGEATTMDPSVDSTVTVESDCASAGSYDMVAEAIGAVTLPLIGDIPRAVAHSFVKDFVPGPGMAGTATLPAWSDQFDTVTVTFSNVPATALAIAGDSSFNIDNVTYDQADTAITINGLGANNYDALIPMGIGATSVTTSTFITYGAGTSVNGLSGLLQTQTGAGADITYDFATDAIPAVTNGTFSSTDPARPMIDWTGNGGTVANIGAANIDWTDTGTTVTWGAVFEPGLGGPFQIPELPAALSAFEPTAAAVYETPNVSYVGASWVTMDWNALRQVAGAIGDAPSLDETVLVSFPAFMQMPLTLVTTPRFRAEVEQRAKR